MLIIDNFLCMPCGCWFFSSTKSLWFPCREQAVQVALMLNYRVWNIKALCKTQQQLLWGNLNTIVWTRVCWGEGTPTLGSKSSREEAGLLLAQISSVPPGSSLPLGLCRDPWLQGDATSSEVSPSVGVAQSWAWESFLVRQFRWKWAWVAFY